MTVAIVDTPDLVPDLEKHLLDQLYRGALKLPELPDVALKVRQAVDQEEADATAVARIVQGSPSISARLVQVSNSPLYRGHGPVSDIKEAVVRLGLQTSKQLAISLGLGELFADSSAEAAALRRSLWQHSVETAVTAWSLGRSQRLMSAEKALLGGLMHDLGAIPVFDALAQQHLLDLPEDEINALVGRLRGVIGSAILSYWGFDDELVATAAEAEHWFREGADKADCCDLVQIAQLHLSLEQGLQPAEAPPIHQLPALMRLFKGVDEYDAWSESDELRAERENMQALLAG